MFINSSYLRSSFSDDRLSGAQRIGILSGRKTIRNAVGLSDQVDYYSFKLGGRSSFNLSLNRLQNNVDVFLLKANGRPIARSVKAGKKPEAINTTLASGTYYVQVQQKNGNSKYKLTLNAAPSVASSPSPSPLPSPERLRFVAQTFLGGSRLLRLDTATGETAVLATERNFNDNDDYMEVASWGNELFVTKGFNAAYPGGLVGQGLYRIDPNTGAESFIGQTGITIDGNPNFPRSVEALGFTSSGQLYGVINNVVSNGNFSPNSPGFYSIDKTTGQATFIAAIPVTGILQGVDDIAYDAASGRFLASFRRNENSSSLLSIGLAGDVQELGRLPARLTGLFFENGRLNGFTYATTSASPSVRLSIDLTRKTVIGGVIEVFESAALDFKPPQDFAGFVTGAG